MVFFEWKDEYLTGNSRVDSQHRKLCSLLNRLHRARRNGASRGEFAIYLSELVSHARVHFKEEEEILAEAGSPLADLHRLQHLVFSRKIEVLKERLLTAPTPEFSEAIFAALRSWVEHHVLAEGFEAFSSLSDGSRAQARSKTRISAEP